MKLLFHTLVLVALTATASHAGSVLVTNYDESSGRQLPITTVAGTPIFTGGIVQAGTFTTTDPSGLIADLTSPAGLAALLGDFISYGPSSAIGVDFPGLFASAELVPILPYSPLVGKNIYTLIGNASTLAASTQLGIVRHPVAFDIDAPFFATVADISGPGVTILHGGAGPGVTTLLGVSASSLQLGIPEPSSALLLWLGLMGVVVRRRS